MENNSQDSVLLDELVQKPFLISSQNVAVLKQGTRYTTSCTFSRRRDKRFWRACSPTPSPSELPTFVYEIGLSDSCLYIYLFIHLFTYFGIVLFTVFRGDIKTTCTLLGNQPAANIYNVLRLE
jgi:hypothetical protein